MMFDVLLMVSLALAPSAGSDGDIEALKRTAIELTKAKKLGRAARVWTEIAESESATDEERDLAVMRGVGTYRFAYDAQGAVQYLCDAHNLLSSYLERTESKEADYLGQFLPEIEADLVDDLGDTWRAHCDPTLDAELDSAPLPPAGVDDPSQSTLPSAVHARSSEAPDHERVPKNSRSDLSGRRARAFMISGAVLTGSGASLLAVMAYAWSRALDASQEIDALPADGGPVTEDVVLEGTLLHDEGKRFEHLAIATAIAGGALVGAGVGILAHGTKLRRRALTVSPHASTRGGGVSILVRF